MPSPGLLEAVRRLPNQVRDVAVAAADTDGLPNRRGIRMVVIFGVGAGRVAGDVIEALSEFHASVPVISAGALTQSWIDDSTLAIILSPWGEEAGAVPALEDALAAGARVVAITSGGELGEVCAKRGVPVVPVDPQAGPAVGLGVLIVPVLVLLERLGVATGVNRVISNVAAQFQDRHQALDNEADAIERLAEASAGQDRDRDPGRGLWVNTRRVDGSWNLTALAILLLFAVLSQGIQQTFPRASGWPRRAKMGWSSSCCGMISNPRDLMAELLCLTTPLTRSTPFRPTATTRCHKCSICFCWPQPSVPGWRVVVPANEFSKALLWR